MGAKFSTGISRSVASEASSGRDQILPFMVTVYTVKGINVHREFSAIELQ